MTIKIQLYAGARERVGADFVEIPLPDSATLSDLSNQLGQAYPELAPLLRHSRLAVNAAYADAQDRIAADDEIALIPPVSGG